MSDVVKSMIANAKARVSARERRQLPAIIDLADERNPERIVFAGLVLDDFIANKWPKYTLGSFLDKECSEPKNNLEVNSLKEFLEHIHADMCDEYVMDNPVYKYVAEQYRFRAFDTEDVSCMPDILESLAKVLLNEPLKYTHMQIFGSANVVLRYLVEDLNLYKIDHQNTSYKDIRNRNRSYIDYIREHNGLNMCFAAYD